MYTKEEFKFASDKELKEINEYIEFASAMNERMAMNLMRKTDGTYVVDTLAADRYFVKDFATTEMKMAMPYIAHAFIMNEAENLKNYDFSWYSEASWCDTCITDGFSEKVLNCILYAARQGSAYSIKLLQYLYKTYYRSEYKILKRFRTLTATEVLDILGGKRDSEKSVDRYGMSRIITIAPFFAIKMTDTDTLFAIMTELEEREEQSPVYGGEFLTPPDGLFQECLEKIDELFPNFTPEEFIKKNKAYMESEKFIGTALMYNGFSQVFHLFSLTDRKKIQEQLAYALMLLKMTDKKREYSKEELERYGSLYLVVQALCDIVSDTNDIMDIVLKGHDYYQDDENYGFIAEDVLATGANMPQNEKKALKQPIVISRQSDEKDAVDSLSEEVSRLRDKLRIKEMECNRISSLYNETKIKLNEKQELLQNYEKDRQELIALREFVFSQTSEDIIADDTVSLDEMKKAIGEKKLVIIGGHENWTKKLKEKFPKWTFVPANTSTVSVSLIAGADKVFFFTEFLSHTVYYRYMNEIQSKGIDFGYIHSINIDSNIRQIYAELSKK